MLPYKKIIILIKSEQVKKKNLYKSRRKRYITKERRKQNKEYEEASNTREKPK